MAIISLSPLKGRVIQRKEQANRIVERRALIKERQINCLTPSTVIRRETTPVAILHEVLLWEMILADPVKETTENLGIMVTEGVVREE